MSVVNAQKALQLLQLLEGLSGQPGVPLEMHVLWLRGPTVDKTPSKLRLSHILAGTSNDDEAFTDATGSNDHSWVVRQEGLAMRGRGVGELAAGVRSVTNVHCKGNDIPRFWLGMGFVISHEALHKGHFFTLCLSAVQIHVLLLKVYRLEVRNDMSSKVDVQPGQLLLEVTATVEDEDHIRACKAIGSLGEMMKHICDLQKP